MFFSISTINIYIYIYNYIYISIFHLVFFGLVDGGVVQVLLPDSGPELALVERAGALAEETRTALDPRVDLCFTIFLLRQHTSFQMFRFLFLV